MGKIGDNSQIASVFSTLTVYKTINLYLVDLHSAITIVVSNMYPKNNYY